MRDLYPSDVEWLAQQFEELTSEMIEATPSQWAESKRHLTPAMSPLPGKFRFSVAPYLREIVDCLGVDSPVREVAIMKGVQVCMTTGVLENAIGYVIDHVKTAPMMLVTADAELAKLRMESNVTPMLQLSELDHLIKSSDEVNTRKSGKALEVSTPIPTPKGFRPIGELEVGDQVYAADGSAVSIDCVSPVHERECFEVTFANGEKIVASDDHRWSVSTRFYGSEERQLFTTAKMFADGVKRGSDYAFRVDVACPVEGQPRDLLIKPYTLGAWLGDGSSRGANIAVGELGMPILQRVAGDGYESKQWTTTAGKCSVYGLYVPGCDGKGTQNFYSLLRRLGLIRNKHIPLAYLEATVADREDLLRGIMDTDGCCSVGGACQVTQKNRQLALDIWSLVNSLGMKATIRERKARSQRGTESTVSVVEFFADSNRPVFTLPYKLERQKLRLASRSYVNSVVDIQPVGKRQVKCIGVNHNEHLFLCGHGYIPTHNTDKKIEWVGGGFLIPFGAVNANKLRSIPIQFMLRDEIDGWKDVVGKDGDPIKLSTDRTAAYESSRKILDLSTPTIRGQSKIEKRFLQGDQRYYYVCCLECGHPQVLRWRRTQNDTGLVTGMVWETEGGRLVSGSVRYCCQNCGHAHTNDDKTRLLDPKHGAEWRPTATPANPSIRSYHVSALYSPVGMQTWEACVAKWFEAWDVERERARDVAQLQVFYNNVLGETFELRGGEKIRFEMVSAHRRHDYSFGEVPNRFAAQHCGGPALLLVCTVDVHKDNLAVGVWAWCREKRVFLVDYWRFGENPEKPGQLIGDTENLDDPHTWVRLRKLIEEREYIADDGKRYRLSITLIDSGYRADDVYRFCAEYASGVYPVKGREAPPKSAKFSEFSEFTTPMGTMGYGITVDIYKERWSPALRRSWDGLEQQGDLVFNAPLNVTDKQLKELTAESKRERIDPRTKQRIGWEWHRTSGAANELWDLLVYANAALDMLAWDVCRRQLELDQVEWNRFYEICEKQKLFYTG